MIKIKKNKKRRKGRNIKQKKNTSRIIIILLFIALFTTVTALLALNIFKSSIDVYTVRYNKGDNELKITLINKADKDAHFEGTYTLILPEGTKEVMGDIEPILIKSKELKTVVYDVELTELYNYKLKIKLVSGKNPSSLTKYRYKKVDVLFES